MSLIVPSWTRWGGLTRITWCNSTGTRVDGWLYLYSNDSITHGGATIAIRLDEKTLLEGTCDESNVE